MSTIKALAPYRTETFRPFSAQPATPAGNTPKEREEQHQPRRNFARPARSAGFLAQLILHSDADLRRNLGRQDIVEARKTAYGTALAQRPSAAPLQFLHVIDIA
jgi:hypothetical protein